MPRNPVPRRALLLLVVTALVLPIVVLVVGALSVLMGAMGDEAGSAVLLRIIQAGAILWVLDLIFLLLAQGLGALSAEGRGDSEEE